MLFLRFRGNCVPPHRDGREAGHTSNRRTNDVQDESPREEGQPEGHGEDWWRIARGLFAGGFRRGDRVINTFSYHFTPAGSMVESGALALGCTVLPSGIGQTEMQVASIRALGVSGYVGTPSFLKLIAEKADELRVDISSLKRAQVGAEYLPPEKNEEEEMQDPHMMVQASTDPTVFWIQRQAVVRSTSAAAATSAQLSRPPT